MNNILTIWGKQTQLRVNYVPRFSSSNFGNNFLYELKLYEILMIVLFCFFTVTRLESTEMDQSENEDYSMMSSPLPGKKDKRDDSDNDKPRGRKKQSLLDQEDSLSMDELSKSTQESKPRSGQRGRKRAAATSESDDQQWPDKRLKEDLEFEDEQNSPPKKGRRGRPPKSAKASAAKEEPVAKTPKRGRKKAVAVEIPQDDEEESLDIADEQDYENVEQKRRGKAPGRASRKTAQK